MLTNLLEDLSSVSSVSRLIGVIAIATLFFHEVSTASLRGSGNCGNSIANMFFGMSPKNIRIVKCPIEALIGKKDHV